MLPAESPSFVLMVRGRQRILDGIVTVGRSTACDIVLHRDDEASRLHARFSLQADGAYIEDLDSTNGTFVGGERVIGKRRLQHFDLVRVGSSLISLNRDTRDSSPELDSMRSFVTSADPTRAADIFEVLERAATKAIAANLPRDAENVTAVHLARLLQEAREQTADSIHVERGIRIAAALARHLPSARWLDYLIELHAALARPVDSELVELLGASPETNAISHRRLRPNLVSTELCAAAISNLR
jgi:pSer/pThr/pTyr-binding forkhead associated (FHA) protein